MKPQQRAARAAVATLEGPRILHLHPTHECALDCTPCYLKSPDSREDLPVDVFAGIAAAAARDGSFRELHVSINVDREGSSRNRDALEAISAAIRGTSLALVVSTNFENARDWGAKPFEACEQVLLAVDEYKFPRLKLPADFWEQVTVLQAEGRVVGLNLLLSQPLLAHLTLARLRRWLSVSDRVYLVAPKGITLDFSRQELLDFFDRLTPLWQEPDRFFHLEVDPCIKPHVFPWNQLCTEAEGAFDQLNVLPDGRVCWCDFAAPIHRLSAAGEVAELVRSGHPGAAEHGPGDCPGIRFRVD